MRRSLLLSLLLIVLLNYSVAYDCPHQSAHLTPNQGAYHFWTPGFPGAYPATVKCLWTISSPAGSEINITMWTPFSTDECCAKMTIYEGKDASGNKIKEWSGDHPAGTNLIVPNVVTVQFESTSNDNGKTGFHAAAAAFSVPTTVTPDTTTHVIEPKCPKQDITFILDSSQSVGKANFELMKQFAVKLTKEFTFGDDYAHFGLITYSRGSLTNFAFNKYDTLEAVDDAIQDAFWDGEMPKNPAIALYTAKWLYEHARGGRDDAVRTIILISDGPHSSWNDDPADPARVLREEYGARIISIRAPEENAEANYKELVSISGEADLVINVTKWDMLLSQAFADTMERMPSSSPCPVPPTTSTTATGPPTTRGPPAACQTLDIVFVVDSSQSVGADNFGKLMLFLVDFTKEFKVDGHKFTQFALVIFNNRAYVEINLGEFTDVDSLDARILRTSYTTGNTNTKDALEVVRDEVFRSAYYRLDVPQIVILITDGVHTNEPPFEAARSLRSSPYNATILAVGIRGINGELLTNDQELVEITGDPKLVYNNLTYDNLDKIIDWTIERFPCKTKCPADVLFVVETSEIMGSATVMDKILHEMVPEMASIIGVGSDSSHAALVTFSSPDYQVMPGPDRHSPVSKVQFDFSQGITYERIYERCGNLTWNQVYGVSDLNLGMKLAMTAFKDSMFGRRNNVPKAVVVIATGFHDEASNCCEDPTDNIKHLQHLTGYNTYVVTVDIPGRTNRTVLNMIAGAEERVYDMKDYKNVSYDIRTTLQTIDCSPRTLVPCPKMTDIVILLHYSTSSGESEFVAMRNFAAYLLDAFSIDNYDANIALVTYSDDWTVEFDLDMMHTKSDIMRYIMSLPPTPPSGTAGQMALAQALDGIANYVFGHAGDRDDNIAPNAVILITDQLDYNGADFEAVRKVAHDKLKYYDVLLLTLTAGSISVNLDQAQNISFDDWGTSEHYNNMTCNHPGDCQRHDYHAYNYSYLTPEFDEQRLHLAQMLQNDACANRYTTRGTRPPTPQSTPSPSPTTPTPPRCYKLDLVFVIDESQSVGVDSYEDIKKFLKSIATYLNDGSNNFIAPDDVRLSLVRFSTMARVEYYLDTLTSLEKWNKGVETIHWMNGLTNTGKALQLVETEVFTTANGYRPEVPAMVILITDGNWNIGPDPIPIAFQLRVRFNAKILTVAVGNDIDFGTLHDISGSSDYFFNVTEYGKLDTLTEKLGEFAAAAAKLACHVRCPGDVAFLIETSELVTESGVEEVIFHNMDFQAYGLFADKKYVLNMTEQFNIGASYKRTHEALVHFSNPPMAGLGHTDVLFDFNGEQTIDAIEQKLTDMSWPDVHGLSDLGGGLRMVRDRICTAAGGERRLPPDILIVFALGYWDQDQPNFLDPFPEAQALRDQGVNIYTVMVPLGGPHGKVLELASRQCETDSCNKTLIDIAGSLDRFYSTDNFFEIPAIVNRYLYSKECYSPPPIVLDVVFVVDSSQSVGVDSDGRVTDEGFDSIKDFLAGLVDKFSAVGPQDTQFGLITYSLHAHKIFLLNKYSDKTAIKTEIQAQIFIGDTSRPTRALEAAEDYLKPENGERSSAPNVVVFFMDGDLKVGAPDPVPVADILRTKYGAKIIAIGNEAMGHSPRSNLELLKKIAGVGSVDAMTGQVFQTDGWDKVSDLLTDVFDAMPENSVTG